MFIIFTFVLKITRIKCELSIDNRKGNQMNLETSKKVLRIAGILSIIGAVFALIVSLAGIFGGGALANKPGIEGDTELQQTAGGAIAAGFLFLYIAVVSLIEGIVSYLAGKKGTKGLATVALIFAVLSIIGDFTSFFRGSMEASSIVGSVIDLAIDALVVYAAYVVRKNAEA